ncbi:DUF1330 domain-containing protein [soil metagenome]
MIDFDAAALREFQAVDTDAPVVMMNLLRFVPGGAAKYQEYADEFSRNGIDERYGLEIAYVGVGGVPLVAESGQEWDMVVLVRYPSRRHFVEMVNDPDYQRFEHLRRSALVEAVLQPTTAMG